MFYFQIFICFLLCLFGFSIVILGFVSLLHDLKN